MPDIAAESRRSAAAALAGELLARLPTLTEGLVGRIRASMEFYGRSGLIPAEDLADSCRRNLEFMLRHVAHEMEVDLDAPRQTGRRRAEQGVPLAMVQSAFRIGFGFLWEQLVTEARASGAADDGDLVAIASDVWAFNDAFTTAMITSFNETMSELMLQRDQQRSALLEAVLQGGAGGTTHTILEAANLLGLPYVGTFAVVVADAPGLARHALPKVEPALHAHEIGSVWRLTPDLHLGIVSMRSAEALESLLTVLRAQAVGRVGVSPVFSRLDHTPQALYLARIALAGRSPGAAYVSVFEDAPLPMLVVSAPTTSARIGRQILGPVLDLPDSDRELLLATLTAFYQVDGSANAAAEILYCHANTVRYRLRRLEQLTGRSVERPQESAELYVALNAVCTLPDVMDGEQPSSG